MVRIVFLLILAFTFKTQAELTSCLPGSATTILWDVPVESSVERTWPLSKHVQLSAVKDGEAVKMKVEFDPKFEGVSLPYTVFAVLVVRDGEVVGWWDFSSQCRGPGASFFPGRSIRLPVAKLVGGTQERLQIMVWGKL